MPATDRIELIAADITKLDVDVVVNAANRALAGGGGVDGAIHRAAGPELARACREIGGCPTGKARITPGFGLTAKWIAHAVGPIWRGGKAGEPGLLAGCYRSALQLAAEKHARTIAFPAISCGVYGYPLADAAVVAVTTVAATLPELPSIERVFHVCHGPGVLEAYEQALARLRASS
ncbi:MAG: O-acetyl-ADP-ribose deacetylase [Gammaproteobacteria bacterium]